MKKSVLKKIMSLGLVLLIALCCVTPTFAGTVKIDTDIPMLDAAELKPEWKEDQNYTLSDPAPWNLDELKTVCDVKDPRSVAAYFVWAVTRMVDNYDDGMQMMKYLFADLEPYGRGFTEGGKSGKAGWDTYFNERLKSFDYCWLPRAYFEGANADNGFSPERPLTLELYYNDTNTQTLNAQAVEQLGRLSIVYWVKSHAAGNQVNITVSKFEGSDRWYVTSGATSAALFYDQRGAVGNSTMELLKKTPNDTSTQAEHSKVYGGVDVETGDSDDDIDVPFTDISSDDYWYKSILWAYENGVTSGTSETTFGPRDLCTRGQVVTFLWRAAGQPSPTNFDNPFTDVKNGDYYFIPVLWAVEKGITSGTSATTFAPDETCSSAHIITFLYRACGIGSNGWYEEARGWAKGAGLLDNTGLSVSPEENCPRGAVVTFLNRVYK